MQFSANLGFLWSELALPDAIKAAKQAGFAAVECHWPYNTPAIQVAQALADTGLPMLGLNTRRGDVAAGDNGLAAIPARQQEARAGIDEAIAYADTINASAIHVMAGFASGSQAHETFLANLRYASELTPRTILIEPLNRHDAPGYFLHSTDQAAAIIRSLNKPNIKLMFDCYHVGRSEGDVITRIKALLPLIGHIQFASVPTRGAPDQGELNYSAIFKAIAASGWTRPLGAEYKPNGATEPTLGWMQT